MTNNNLAAIAIKEEELSNLVECIRKMECGEDDDTYLDSAYSSVDDLEKEIDDLKKTQ